MIRRLLDSDMDLALRSGFIYVPLLFDPSVEQEILSPRKPGALIQIERRYLLKALKVESLLENYAALWPESYERLREGYLRKCTGVPRLQQMPVDGKLRTILFGVMPHFIRGHRGLERRRLGEGEILDWIEGKVLISGGTGAEAGQVVVYDPARRTGTPAEVLGLYELMDRRRIDGYERESAACTYRPEPSVIMVNQIIAGLMVDAYRILLCGQETTNIFYDSTADKRV